MSPSLKTYRASGRVAAAAVPRVLLLGLPFVLVAAALYAVVIRYNPFIYFSFLATGIFGAAVGIAAVRSAQSGRSRSLPFNLIAALALTLIALWAHWLVWLSLHDGGTQMALDLVGKGPLAWGDFFNQLAENYHLSIGRARRSSSAEMGAGSMLWLWRVEAGAVLLLALFSAWAGTADRVFCESSGRWAEKAGELVLVPGDVLPGNLLDAIRAGDYAALQGLASAPPLPAPGESRRVLVVTLTSEPQSADCRLIEIEIADDSLDDKGKLKRRKRPLVPRHFVPAEIYAALNQRLSPVAAPPQPASADT